MPAARAGARRAVVAAVPVVLALAVALPFARDVAEGFAGGGRELSQRQFGRVVAQLWGMQYDIGQRVRRIARPGDKLFVGGAEPGFNFYAGLAPPSRYFFVYDSPERRSAMKADIDRAVCSGRPPPLRGDAASTVSSRTAASRRAATRSCSPGPSTAATA